LTTLYDNALLETKAWTIAFEAATAGTKALQIFRVQAISATPYLAAAG
jgi:hypothetical protein